MGCRVAVSGRDLLLLAAGLGLGVWITGAPEARAQAPQPITAQGCGDWVMQVRQTENVRDFNAFVLNTRTGELFYLKDEHKIPAKTTGSAFER